MMGRLVLVCPHWISSFRPCTTGPARTLLTVTSGTQDLVWERLKATIEHEGHHSTVLACTEGNKGKMGPFTVHIQEGLKSP